MRKAFESWVHLAAERGWAEYRAPAAFQDLVSSTYSYNNHALRRLRETDQGCDGSQRHPLGRSLWRVAQAPEEELT